MPKRHRRKPSPGNAFLPMTPDEVAKCGWDAVDIAFVTGDAYVDHPSFAMAMLGRVLEDAGYRVAILSQPDWRSCDAWKTFGRPRIAFAVSAGNMDSMLNHYTANRKVRNEDAYSPDGQIGLRPDRATLAYCQRAREAYREVPIIAGGVEASLRRIAHYDYWSDKVRRSILFDAKPDLLVYGMGEKPLLEIVKRLSDGEPARQIRDVRGTAFRLGASESPDDLPPVAGASDERIELPFYEDVKDNPRAFAEMTRLAYLETNPLCARRLIQRHGSETAVVNPPTMPMSENEMDRIYGLPFTRQAHPSYGDRKIPALETVRHSIQIMRGCFGGCAFCSLTAHQGRIIQSRSEESVLKEIERLARDPSFHGTVSDLGGPSANMYRMGCSRPDGGAGCRKTSCLHPSVCKNLKADHGPLIRLMKQARKCEGVKHVFVASGVRTDLAQRSTAYLHQLAAYHVGGQLSVAPEHADPEVLKLMKKPPIDDFDRFVHAFHDASVKAGKRQFVVPYFIAGHPGSDLRSMIRVAEYLHKAKMRPRQVQDFIPGPFDLATCMYHTGIDPMTGRKVYVAKGGRERRLQRALLQYFLPTNYHDVREALQKAGREDLIGNGPKCLIPAHPPREAGDAKKRRQGGRRKPGGKQRPVGSSRKRPRRR